MFGKLALLVDVALNDVLAEVACWLRSLDEVVTYTIIYAMHLMMQHRLIL